MSSLYPDLGNNFPESIDNFDKFVDPDIASIQAINQYCIKFDAGDIVGAKKVLNDNPRLKYMIINADNLNKIRDGLISLQRYYLNDVQQYLVNIVKHKGYWTSSAKYTKYDVVTYINNQAIESYMGVKSEIAIGTLPTDSTAFISLTLRGEQGASGTGMSPRGAWNSLLQYYKNDCAAYNNILWYAKADNIDSVPQDNTDVWEALLKMPSTKWEDIPGKPSTFPPSDHGNHVPTLQTASNKKFLRNDNSWQEVLPANIGAEPAFAKNSAFNKNFGTAAGTICQGNDSRLFDARPANGGTASAVPWNGISGKPGSFVPSAHTHDDRYYTEAEANNLLNGRLSISGGTVTGNVTVNGTLTAANVVGASWNDYAEYRQSFMPIHAGLVVIEDIKNDDHVTLCNERLNPTAMIVSDTFGFVIGKQDIFDEYSLPIAVSGRVLVHTDIDRNSFLVGDAVCSGRNGTVSKMTSEEIANLSHCIIGVVSSIPKYDTWNSIEIDNRVWIKIK